MSSFARPLMQVDERAIGRERAINRPRRMLTCAVEPPKRLVVDLPSVSVSSADGKYFFFEKPDEWRKMVGTQRSRGHSQTEWANKSFPVVQIRDGERVWSGHVTVNRAGRSCFGSRDQDPDSGQWQVGDSIFYGMQTDCEWRFGDAATGCLGIEHCANINPLRWSGAATFEKTLIDIQAVQRRKDRPIILKIPSGVLSKERVFESCEQAIAHLKSAEGLQTRLLGCDSRPLHEWKIDDTLELGTDDRDFDPSIPRLDQQVYTGVTQAIEALNADSLLCETGICIVYSSRQTKYVLVAREDQKHHADTLWDYYTECRGA